VFFQCHIRFVNNANYAQLKLLPRVVWEILLQTAPFMWPASVSNRLKTETLYHYRKGVWFSLSSTVGLQGAFICDSARVLNTNSSKVSWKWSDSSLKLIGHRPISFSVMNTRVDTEKLCNLRTNQYFLKNFRLSSIFLWEFSATNKLPVYSKINTKS
jgi:hypothetical protein